MASIDTPEIQRLRAKLAELQERSLRYIQANEPPASLDDELWRPREDLGPIDRVRYAIVRRRVSLLTEQLQAMTERIRLENEVQRIERPEL
jgi:hypothetical protein